MIQAVFDKLQSGIPEGIDTYESKFALRKDRETRRVAR